MNPYEPDACVRCGRMALLQDSLCWACEVELEAEQRPVATAVAGARFVRACVNCGQEHTSIGEFCPRCYAEVSGVTDPGWRNR